MSAYNSAHILARALKESEEYKAYQAARALVEKDEGAVWVLSDFRKKQIEMEIQAASGKSPSDEQVAKFNELASAVSLHKPVSDFLMSEMRLLRMVADVQRIIGEALDLWDYMTPSKEEGQKSSES